METSRARRSRARQRWETRAPVRLRRSSTTRATDRGSARLPRRTERSRSRSPGASSTHSAGSSASDSASAYAAQITTHLNHLPAGRLAGRRHLQPFEPSAFWHSAESNRAGTRPARSPEDEPVDDSRDGDAQHVDGVPADRTRTGARQRRLSGRRRRGGAFLADRREYSSTGARAPHPPRRKKKRTRTRRAKRWTRRGEASEAGTWRAEARSSAADGERAAVSVVAPDFLPISRERRRARSRAARPKRCLRSSRNARRSWIFGAKAWRCRRVFGRLPRIASETWRATRAWGGTGTLDGTVPARRDAPERSRRRNEGTGTSSRGL